MDKLTVAFNGIEVGTLTRHGSGAMEFHYNPDWLTRQGARAISLSLPLSEKIYRGVQVYNFFSITYYQITKQSEPGYKPDSG